MQKGEQKANHRYIARALLGSGKYKYFYTSQEIASYKVKRKKNNTLNKPVDKLKKKKNKSSKLFTTAHTSTPSVSTITGYVPGGGKPNGVSDERWALLQRLWAKPSNNASGVVNNVKNVQHKNEQKARNKRIAEKNAETKVRSLVASGKTYAKIAKQLGISPSRVAKLLKK